MSKTSHPIASDTPYIVEKNCVIKNDDQRDRDRKPTPRSLNPKTNAKYKPCQAPNNGVAVASRASYPFQPSLQAHNPTSPSLSFPLKRDYREKKGADQNHWLRNRYRLRPISLASMRSKNIRMEGLVERWEISFFSYVVWYLPWAGRNCSVQVPP